jgi:hypothetical protein
MDSGSDDCRVPPPGETADGSNQESQDPRVGAEPEEVTEKSGCFTERELERLLPSIPDWMRKPPPLRRQPRQPNLFEEERDE